VGFHRDVRGLRKKKKAPDVAVGGGGDQRLAVANARVSIGKKKGFFGKEQSREETEKGSFGGRRDFPRNRCFGKGGGGGGGGEPKWTKRIKVDRKTRVKSPGAMKGEVQNNGKGEKGNKKIRAQPGAAKKKNKLTNRKIYQRL